MPAMDTIRASPYERGLYFVGGTVGTAQWQVGTRYTLDKVLGHGGFSSVCLATDHQTGDKVALKRVPDVLSSPENAKRVLREVCILRRLSHPNVIGLRDCFVRPSATGQCRLINGKLVNLSIDVYIAMEYAEGGDLFHLKGQMSAEEVKSVMWQLASCVKYLHDLHVWHRDIKSQNVFASWEGGELIVKLGDFGSARSAIPEGYPSVEQTPPSRHNTLATLQPRAHMHSVDSYDEMHRTTQHQDIFVRVENAAKSGRTGFKAPLTRVVATPCYRAPEVVMSRGGYSAAIDIWGLGCILGELLQRVAHVGSAATPNLQIAPLFAIHDMPRTPEDGEKYGGPGPGHETTRVELQALFDVVGTPAWADVAEVEHPAWRNYLHQLPGKAPTLYRRFAAAGEVAIDLLSRMLAFDPSRRCSADEVLAHEYFWDLLPEDSGTLEEGAVAGGLAMARRSSRMIHSGSGQSTEGMQSMHSSRGDLLGPPGTTGQQQQQQLHQRGRSMGGSPTPMLPPVPRVPHTFGSPTRHPSQLALPSSLSQHSLAPGGPSPRAASGAVPEAMQLRSPTAAAAQAQAGPGTTPLGVAAAQQGLQNGDSDVAMIEASPFDQPQGGLAQPGQLQQHQAAAGVAAAGRERGRALHYWQETDPARALGMLEDEMASIAAADSAPGGEGCQKLRRMLELECEAIAASHGGSFGAPPGSAARRKVKLPTHEQGVLSGLLQSAGPGLQLDTAGDSMYDPADYGAGRLNNVADTWNGRELDPEKYLGPQRHGEWTAFSGTGPPPGPRWGVSAMPPGVDESSMDPRVAAVIKAQQLR